MEYVRVCMCVCLCLTFHVKNLGLWNAKCTQKPFSHVDIEVHGLAIFDHAKQRAFSLTLMRSCLRKQRPKLTLAVVCSKFHQKWLKIAATKRTWMAESAMPDHCHFSTGSVVPPTHLKSPGIIASSGERSENIWESNICCSEIIDHKNHGSMTVSVWACGNGHE